MLVLGDQFPVRRLRPLFVAGHAVLVEDTFALGADLGDPLHGFEGGGDEVAVVADGDVAAGGEGEGAVDNHFFAGGFAEGFGPFELVVVLVRWGDGKGMRTWRANLAWISLHLELWKVSVAAAISGMWFGSAHVLVTFTPAEFEYPGIVSDEGDTCRL